MSCEAIFEPAEWKSIWRVIHRQDPPSQPPSLSEVVVLVVKLCGYTNRAHGAEPGPDTIWRGLARLHDIALCWQIFGPEADVLLV